MPLTPQQQATLNAIPVSQRAQYQQAYEADNAKAGQAGSSRAQPSYSSTGGFPSTIETRTERNPAGTIQSTSTPNLAPQQQQFAMEQLKAQGTQESGLLGQQGTIQSSLASQQALAEQDLQKLKFGQSKEAFQDRLGAIQGLMGQQGSNAPQVQLGQGTDEAGARAAAFARAKELAGSNALSGLKSVQDLAANRGMTGSSFEAGLAGEALGGGLGILDDYTREQLIQDLNRAANVSDTTYQGNITQRGQDLARQQALFGLLNQGGLY